MKIFVAINQIHVACCSNAVISAKLKLAGAFERYLGHPHDIPQADHYFRVTDQEQIHFRIAGNGLRGHTTEIARVLDNSPKLLCGIGSQLIERNIANGCNSGVSGTLAVGR